jgi:hypothetical protein
MSEIKTTPEMMNLNNPNVVKTSSLTNSGLLMSKYKWIRRPDPFTTIKPDQTSHNNHQSLYIDYLARKTLVEISDCDANTDEHPRAEKCCNIPGTNYHSIVHDKFIVKPDKHAVSSSDYIRALDKKCGVDEKFYYPRNTNGIPYGCGSNKII